MTQIIPIIATSERTVDWSIKRIDKHSGTWLYRLVTDKQTIVVEVDDKTSSTLRTYNFLFGGGHIGHLEMMENDMLSFGYVWNKKFKTWLEGSSLKGKIKDWQKLRFYAAEARMTTENTRFKNSTERFNFIDNILESDFWCALGIKVTVKFIQANLEGNDPIGECTRLGKNSFTISLDGQYCDKLDVIHEFSHAMANSAVADGSFMHGPEFVKSYLVLVDMFLGTYTRKVKHNLNLLGVEY